MKTKKSLMFFLPFLALGLVGCTEANTPKENDEDSKIRAVYRSYQENGGTLSYEEWLASIKGEQGEPGKPGEDGEDGESAYEIYCKYHPEYEGTEEDWINSFCKEDSTDYSNTQDFSYRIVNYKGQKGYIVDWIYSSDKVINLPTTFNLLPVIGLDLTIQYASRATMIDENIESLKEINIPKGYRYVDLSYSFEGIKYIFNGSVDELIIEPRTFKIHDIYFNGSLDEFNKTNLGEKLALQDIYCKDETGKYILSVPNYTIYTNFADDLFDEIEELLSVNLGHNLYGNNSYILPQTVEITNDVGTVNANIIYSVNSSYSNTISISNNVLTTNINDGFDSYGYYLYYSFSMNGKDYSSLCTHYWSIYLHEMPNRIYFGDTLSFSRDFEYDKETGVGLLTNVAIEAGKVYSLDASYDNYSTLLTLKLDSSGEHLFDIREDAWPNLFALKTGIYNLFVNIKASTLKCVFVKEYNPVPLRLINEALSYGLSNVMDFEDGMYCENGDCLSLVTSFSFDEGNVLIEWEYDEDCVTTVARHYDFNDVDLIDLYPHFPDYDEESFTFDFKVKKITADGVDFTYSDLISAFPNNDFSFEVLVNKKTVAYKSFTISEINAVSSDPVTYSDIPFPSTFDIVDYTTGDPWFKPYPNDETNENGYCNVKVKGKIIFISPDGNFALLADGDDVIQLYAGSMFNLNSEFYPALANEYVQVYGNMTEYRGTFQLGFISDIKPIKANEITEPTLTYCGLTDTYLSSLKTTYGGLDCEKQAVDGLMNSLKQVTGVYVEGSLVDSDGNEISNIDNYYKSRFSFKLKVGEEEMKICYDYHVDNNENGNGRPVFKAIKKALAQDGAITVMGTMRYETVGYNDGFILNDGSCWTLVPFKSGHVSFENN